MNEDDDDIIFIAIEYQGRRYMGAMGFKALLFVSRFAFLLQSHTGLSIKEIGDLELEL